MNEPHPGECEHMKSVLFTEGRIRGSFSELRYCIQPWFRVQTLVPLPGESLRNAVPLRYCAQWFERCSSSRAATPSV